MLKRAAAARRAQLAEQQVRVVVATGADFAERIDRSAPDSACDNAALCATARRDASDMYAARRSGMHPA
eukprot:SAG11_NODE_31032_length_295_cov_1.061224_1_plen_68_part_10